MASKQMAKGEDVAVRCFDLTQLCSDNGLSMQQTAGWKSSEVCLTARRTGIKVCADSREDAEALMVAEIRERLERDPTTFDYDKVKAICERNDKAFPAFSTGELTAGPQRGSFICYVKSNWLGTAVAVAADTWAAKAAAATEILRIMNDRGFTMDA